MAYDGSTWNEGDPQDSTVANTIDDHIQDVKKGVRARMALEHLWPASQAATASGGRHMFVGFVTQTGAPSIAGNTAGVVWVGTDKTLNFTNSAGTDVIVVNTAGKVPAIAGGTLGSIAICSSANPTGLVALAGSADGYVLVTHSNTAAPTWSNPASGDPSPQYARPQAAATRIYWGSGSVNANSNLTVNIGGTMSDTVYAAMVTPNQAGSATFDVNISVGTRSTTTFRVDNKDGDVACAFTWLIVGSGT